MRVRALLYFLPQPRRVDECELHLAFAPEAISCSACDVLAECAFIQYVLEECGTQLLQAAGARGRAMADCGHPYIAGREGREGQGGAHMPQTASDE